MKFCQSAMLVIRNSSPGFLSVAICSHVDHVGLGGSRGHCRGDSLFPLQEVGKATRHGMLVGNVGMFRKGADAARTNKNRHSYSKYISIYKPHVNTCETMSTCGGTQDKTTRPESLRPGFMISRAYCTIPSCWMPCVQASGVCKSESRGMDAGQAWTRDEKNDEKTMKNKKTFPASYRL